MQSWIPACAALLLMVVGALAVVFWLITKDATFAKSNPGRAWVKEIGASRGWMLREEIIRLHGCEFNHLQTFQTMGGAVVDPYVDCEIEAIPAIVFRLTGFGAGSNVTNRVCVACQFQSDTIPSIQAKRKRFADVAWFEGEGRKIRIPGDDEFERNWIIFGSDEEAVVRYLDESIRRALCQLTGATTVEWADKTLLLVGRQATSAAAYVEVYEDALAMTRAIKARHR